MSVLTCDVCGGNLTIDAGGKTATCEFCNAKHTMERLKEKVMEIKGSVQIDGAVQASQTGTADDIRQWKMLVNKYLGAYDYQAAVLIINKILEADPTDKETNILYDELQVLKYLNIRDGVLVGYSGLAEKLKIPSGIKKIGKRAFEMGDSLVKIEFDENSELEIIDERAFSQCKCLKWVDLSNCKKLAMIEKGAFCSDRELENVILPDGLSTLAPEVFANDAKLTEIVLPQKLMRMGDRVFAGCHSLKKISIPNSISYMGTCVFEDSGIMDLCLPQQVNRADIVQGCKNLTVLNASIDFKVNYRNSYLKKTENAKGKSYYVQSDYSSVWNRKVDEQKKRNMCEYCGQKIPLMKRTCPSCNNKVRLIKIK